MLNISHEILNPRLLERLGDRARALTRYAVEAGFQAGDVTRQTERGAAGQSIAGIARKNEYGDPATRTPARPFMATTMARTRDTMQHAMAEVARRVMFGNLDAWRGMNQIGSQYVREIQDTIRSNMPPPNSPRTIALKRSSRTLIDTGQMVQSVRHVLTRR
jgi:hypothetical protein